MAQKKKLADVVAQTIKARPTPYEIRDTGNGSVKGLLLRVQPSGHATYYVELARGVREKIGPKEITLTAARTRASILIGEAAANGAHSFKGKRERKRREEAATLEGYLDGMFQDHAKDIADFNNTVKRVKNSFSDLLKKPMPGITELDLRRWDKARKEKVTVATRRRELKALRAILNRAISDKVIDSHQIARFSIKAEAGDDHGQRKLRFLTAEEEVRLRAALDKREADLRDDRGRGNAWRQARRYELMPEFGPDDFAGHLKPMVLLSLLTGLRRGDVFGLKWEHVDLERRQIRKVIEKSSHARRKAGRPSVLAVLPLSAEAHQILEQCYRQRDPESELVFPSPKTGTRLNNTKKGFAAVLESAEITDFRWHDLRHSFASRLVAAGADLNTVRELMTHSDISMTLIYAHLTEQHTAQAVDQAFPASRIVHIRDAPQADAG